MPGISRPTLSRNNERGIRDGSSPRDSYGLEMVGSTTKRFIDFDELDSAIAFYLGYSRISGSDLERLTPTPHPNDSKLFASRVEGNYCHKQIGTNTTVTGEKVAVWDKLELSISYSRFPYKILEDDDVVSSESERFTSIGEERPSADYISMPGGAILYTRSSGSSSPHLQPIPFNTGIVLPVIEFPVTWHRLPESLIDFDSPGAYLKRLIGDGSTKPYLGCVNKTAFKGFAAGTLLFSTYRRVQRPIPVNIAGVDPGFEYDIEYTFAYDPNMWNYKYFFDMQGAGSANGWYLATKGGTYQANGSISDGNCLYNEREFRDLFSVA